MYIICVSYFFFFNDTATTEIYTLSLHDALPIWTRCDPRARVLHAGTPVVLCRQHRHRRHSDGGGSGVADRKSTRLNSSHSQISYAVFCLKKKIQHPLRLSCIERCKMVTLSVFDA